MIRISDLITCDMCNYFKHGECTAEPHIGQMDRSYAIECKHFTRKEEQSDWVVNNSKALQFMIAGMSEFEMISGKTGKVLRYKLEKKEANGKQGENSKNSKFIYWAYTEDDAGVMQYAGVVYFDENDNQFKFGKGTRGNNSSSDKSIISLLFVLNKLYKREYNLNVQIRHFGRCGRCGMHLEDQEELISGLDLMCIGKTEIPEI